MPRQVRSGSGRPIGPSPAKRGASSNPHVASANKWARIEALQRNKAFLAAYRTARDLWKAGVAAIFPAGTYWLRKFAGGTVEEDHVNSPTTASLA